MRTKTGQFLSTSPAWGTTAALFEEIMQRDGFYPRPPRGGRHCEPKRWSRPGPFLSTSPAWGTTGRQGRGRQHRVVSIHVPRVGDDLFALRLPAAALRVSIHVPRVGDDISVYLRCHTRKNVSIHVPRVGDDRKPRLQRRPTMSVSIHVPRVGDDPPGYFPCRNPRLFLSTSPAWGTTVGATIFAAPRECFYPRPPRGGRRQM